MSPRKRKVIPMMIGALVNLSGPISSPRQSLVTGNGWAAAWAARNMENQTMSMMEIPAVQPTLNILCSSEP